MKLEKTFKCENKKLYFLNDSKELSAQKIPLVKADDFIKGSMPDAALFAIGITFKQIGNEDEGYNEEFLAFLRDALKLLEEKHIFTFIIPLAEEEINAGRSEEVTASFKHCARRIKDCTNLAGFALAKGIDKALFISELSAKHEQYVFFSTQGEDSSLVEYSLSDKETSKNCNF